ncbi:aromatic acid exporter family protein [Bacillus carboniphilus]|uniref:Aromatic acid exporter family protein n=1 Tax=Bacillus carboniphilus TaxID=86663 RepID=A0ABY9JYJ2_9BACI|nr:aromatic acid exporter family protein [Bacillus carboniphilus]WLR42691.1 aromatic acid exporter family protein [Bacillus carboniphilus]
MKLGARILKTGIAITLSLFTATLFGLPSPVFAGIAAVFAIQPTIYRSYLSVITQVQANVIGAVLALAFGLVFGSNPIIIGVTAILVIAINIKLKLEDTIPISLVTVIAILQTNEEMFLEFSILRFLTILLGVFSAFIVNLVFIPPKYEHKLFHEIEVVSDEIFKWIRLNLKNVSEHNILKEDIELLKEKLISIDQLYLMYKEENSSYFTFHQYSKSRKLVLFRQMISTTNSVFRALKKLHRLENDFHQTPISFQKEIMTKLECLMSYHEHLLLKFKGKIKAERNIELTKNESQSLLDKIIATGETIQDFDHHLLSIITEIIEYEEHLKHLETLIHSFQQYHHGEKEVDSLNS